jgi:hypothetical protein
MKKRLRSNATEAEAHKTEGDIALQSGLETRAKETISSKPTADKRFGQ